MEKLLLHFRDDRINAVVRSLPEVNAEYAVADQNRKALRELLDPILDSPIPRTISPADCMNFREYLDQDACAEGIAQEELYRQGYRDCVYILRSLGVLA